MDAQHDTQPGVTFTTTAAALRPAVDAVRRVLDPVGEGSPAAGVLLFTDANGLPRLAGRGTEAEMTVPLDGHGTRQERVLLPAKTLADALGKAPAAKKRGAVAIVEPVTITVLSDKHANVVVGARSLTINRLNADGWALRAGTTTPVVQVDGGELRDLATRAATATATDSNDLRHTVMQLVFTPEGLGLNASDGARAAKAFLPGSVQHTWPLPAPVVVKSQTAAQALDGLQASMITVGLGEAWVSVIDSDGSELFLRRHSIGPAFYDKPFESDAAATIIADRTTLLGDCELVVQLLKYSDERIPFTRLTFGTDGAKRVVSTVPVLRNAQPGDSTAPRRIIEARGLPTGLDVGVHAPWLVDALSAIDTAQVQIELDTTGSTPPALRFSAVNGRSGAWLQYAVKARTSSGPYDAPSAEDIAAHDRPIALRFDDQAALVTALDASGAVLPAAKKRPDPMFDSALLWTIDDGTVTLATRGLHGAMTVPVPGSQGPEGGRVLVDHRELRRYLRVLSASEDLPGQPVTIFAGDELTTLVAVGEWRVPLRIQPEEWALRPPHLMTPLVEVDIQAFKDVMSRALKPLATKAGATRDTLAVLKLGARVITITAGDAARAIRADIPHLGDLGDAEFCGRVFVINGPTLSHVARRLHGTTMQIGMSPTSTDLSLQFDGGTFIACAVDGDATAYDRFIDFTPAVVVEVDANRLLETCRDAAKEAATPRGDGRKLVRLTCHPAGLVTPSPVLAAGKTSDTITLDATVTGLDAVGTWLFRADRMLDALGSLPKTVDGDLIRIAWMHGDKPMTVVAFTVQSDLNAPRFVHVATTVGPDYRP